MSLKILSEFNMQCNLNNSSVWKKQHYLRSREDVTSNPPMWILISSNHQQLPENRVTTNPEYTNTQQGLPDMGILSPLSRHASFLALEFIFAGKRLLVDPYFQYFSSSLMYKYQLGLHKHLEQTWYITLYFPRVS